MRPPVTAEKEHCQPQRNIPKLKHHTHDDTAVRFTEGHLHLLSGLTMAAITGIAISLRTHHTKCKEEADDETHAH